MTVRRSLLKMQTEFNSALSIAGLLFLGILTCSFFLWIFHLSNKHKGAEEQTSVRPWPIGWANFGLFLCAIVISIAFANLLTVQLVRLFSEPVAEEQTVEEVDTSEEAVGTDDPEASEDSKPSVDPWFAVLSVLSLQIPMIATFYGLRKAYPKLFGGRLNRKPVALRSALAQTTPYFIRCYPIIWLASLIWLGLLTGLRKLGILDELPPQVLITLLSNGKEPVAIALLVLFAVVLAPIVEEVIFRGAIYRFLKSAIPTFAAQVVSAAIFALMHANLLSFIPLLVIGTFLARIYEKEGNLLLPMIFHAYWNAFSLLMLFLISQSEVPFVR